MGDLVGSLGKLALIWTIGLFLCGSQICYRFFKDRSVGEISALPFLAAFFNCIANFLYGILIDNTTIIIVNCVGFNLQAVYIMFYLYYTTNKKKLIHQIIFVMLMSSIAVLYSFFESDTSTSSFYIGCLASFASVIMFGSPLSTIKTVMKTQSTESLSFPLCFANLVCSSLWAVYGSLIQDKFVIVPNIVGALLGFAQVSLFAKFSTLSLSTRSKLKSDDPLSM